jgi:hypothetical protein
MRVTRRFGRTPKVNLKSECFTLSKAKTYLGRLMDKASKGQTVYIVRGVHRFVLLKVQPIDPVPMRPLGYFANCYSKAEVREENRLAKASIIQVPKDLE